MKTADVIGSISREAGGVRDSVLGLSRSLSAHGVEVSVYSLEDEFTAQDVGAWAGMSVSVFRIYGYRAFGYSRGLQDSLMSRDDVQVAHGHGIWQFPNIALYRWSRKYGRPYLISPHGMLDPWALRRSRWKKWMAGALYENDHLRGAGCLRALCLSEYEAIRRYGLKNPVCVIPHGMDTPPPSETTQSSHEDGRKMLLFVGRIHPKKGLRTLVHALARLRGANRQLVDRWKIVIAGWHQEGHGAELARLIVELGVQDLIELVGPKYGSHKTDLLRKASGFVLPSLSEGLPVAVLDAWAHSLPVIMTPQCNIPDGFECGAAIRIDSSVESVASGLEEFMQMSEYDRKAMGEKGLNLVKTRFQWGKIGTDMKAVYEWLIGGGQPPSCVEMK